MRKIDENKLGRLVDANEILTRKYGEEGSASRTSFSDEAQAWYFGELVRDRRRELKLTQQGLADKVGTARSYIARVESGKTDIQMSSFFNIARALGISFNPIFSPI